MEKYDIQPTNSNLISSISKDVTGRNQSIYYLLRFLNYQDTSWSIAIDSPWGSGKTFFVKQCQLVLDNQLTGSKQNTKIQSALNKLCQNSDEKLKDIQQRHFRTTYYDAWEHDSEADPIISILKTLASSSWSASMKSNLAKVIDVGIDILNITTNVDFSSLKDMISNNKQNDLDLLKKKFNAALSNLAPDSGQLIIFVDELDRCKPTYAVQLLERIKHYFSNPNVTFIFSVDLSQLQNTVKNYYGSHFDGYQYLDRFFDLVISLPEPDVGRYFESTKDILRVNEVFGQVNNSDNYYHQFCAELTKHFSFSLRQLNHFYLKANSASYNLINQSMNLGGWSNNHGLFLIYTFLLPLMIALSQENIDDYNAFINGKASKETLNILSDSTEFSRYYADMQVNNDEIDVKKGVNEIYNAIFGNRSISDNILTISNKCYIENPKKFKVILINACNLLSQTSKLN